MKHLILIISVVLISNVLIAQPQSPVGPTAAGLSYQQFASSSTSYIDGSENVNIPIGQVSEGPLQHAVSIHYNTRGLRVGTIPSHLGLGWGLNAGGMISRSIRGISDGHSNGYGWYEMNDNNYTITDEQAADGDRDAEPDLYHFTVGNFNGSFIIDEYNEFHTIPKSNIKITPIMDASYHDYDFVGFTIVDEFGTKYYFGKDGANDYVEFRHFYDLGGTSDLHTGCCSDDDVNITGWFLYKIESFDSKHTIDFEYVKTGYEYYSFAMQDMLKYYDHINNSYGSHVHRYLGNDNDTDNVFSKSSVKSYVISKISSSTTEIVFNNKDKNDGSMYEREDLPSGSDAIEESDCCVAPPIVTFPLEPKILSSIEIVHLGSSFCTEYKLSHDYFVDNTSYNSWTPPAWTQKKLKLLDIQKFDCLGSVSEPPLVFEYLGNNFFPNYICTGIDHWGFYNGQTGTDLIPFNEIDLPGNITLSYGSANRAPDLEDTKKGVLNKIIYPTGGSLEFEYELNEITEPNPNQSNYLFEFNPCGMVECCYANAGGMNATITVDQDIKDYATLEFYLETASSSCTWSTSEIRVEVLDGSNQYVGTIAYNITNYGQGNTSGYYSVDLINIPFIIPTANYKFIVEGDFLEEASYVRLTNPSAFQTVLVGGLRLKNKKLHDGYDSNKDIITEYNYDQHAFPGRSSGRLFRDHRLTNYTNLTDNSNITQFLFYYNPSYPLYSFNGNHINYTDLTILNNGEGNTKLNFIAPATPGYAFYPSTPVGYNSSLGFNTNREIQNDNGVTLEDTDSVRNQDNNEIIFSANTYIEAPYYSGANMVTKIQVAGYFNYTGIQRLKSSTTQIDEFETEINYLYNTASPDVNYLATEKSIINSDGKTHKTLFEYTSNYIWGENNSSNQNYQGCLKTEFQLRNMRNILWSEISTVDTVKVNGMVTEFKLYNDNGTQASGCTPNNTTKHLRPYRVHRIERTWDSNGNLTPYPFWEIQLTNESYNSIGLLKTSSKPNWPNANRVFAYDGRKRLISSKFGTQEKTYEYYNNTGLLKKITDIHGISMSYEYDDLVRLSKKTNDCNGVFTTFDYSFTSGSAVPDNIITVTQDFTPACETSGMCDFLDDLSFVTTIVTKKYLDGLGREVQTVGVAQQPGPPGSAGDIISAVEYDDHGRAFKTYLPFLTGSSNNGAYVTPSNSWGFGVSNYYSDPLSRIENVDPPGSLSGGNQFYSTNDQNDNVILNHDTNIYYSEGSLKKHSFTDANGVQSIEFSDRLGNLICKRVLSSSNSTTIEETYYQYDDKNRLIKIIPDGADGSSSNSTPDLVFSYLYHGDDQIYKKKIPGSDEITFLYNDRGLLAIQQDGNNLSNGEYLATNYDTYGRVSETGLVVTSSLPANESFSDVNISSTELLTSNTYASHNLIQTQKRILNSADFITENYTYDFCNRLKKTESNTHLDLSNSTSYVVENFYNQSSDIKEVKTTLTLSGTSYTLGERYFYNNVGGLAKYYVNDVDFNSNNYFQKTHLEYNERGEVTEKWLSSPIWQKINYSYTDWGALKTINTPNLSREMDEKRLIDGICLYAPVSGPVDLHDLFYLELFYDDDFDTDGDGLKDNVVLEDGSISAVKWQLRGRREHAYLFDYNEKYELTTADFYEQNDYSVDNNFTKTDLFTTSYSYGDRGLINTINRSGVNMYDYIDPPIPDPAYYTTQANLLLTYHNDSNQLKESNYGTPSMDNTILGFDNVSYDNNGNMVDHPIYDNITYNHLDLIESYDSGSQSEYDATYDAGGGLLSESVYDFIGPFEFKNNSLYKTNIRDGFIDDLGDYNFYIKDHLGNVRVVFSDADGDDEIQSIQDVVAEYHYYPFGLRLNGPWLGPNGNNEIRYQYNSMDFHESDGYTQHADVNNIGLNHTTFRSLDPVLGMWLQIDPKAEIVSRLSPYNSMANNPVSYSDPEGDLPFLAIGIGAGIGGILGGTSKAISGGSFFDGFWKGAIVGGIGGGLGTIGANSFWGNVGLGFGEGAVTGGVASGLDGGNIIKGAFIGGAIGGITRGIGFEIRKSKLKSSLEAPRILANGESLPATNDFLCEYCDKAFPGYEKKYGVSSVRVKNLLKKGKFGKTVHHKNSPWSDIEIDPKAFNNEFTLFNTVGHEFIHAYQHKIGLTGLAVDIGLDYYDDLIEGAAYDWNLHIANSVNLDMDSKWYKYIKKHSNRLGYTGQAHQKLTSFRNIPSFPINYKSYY